MRSAETVVLALRALGETGQTATLTQGANPVAARGQLYSSASSPKQGYARSSGEATYVCTCRRRGGVLVGQVEGLDPPRRR